MLLEKRAPELTDKELVELSLSGKIPGMPLREHFKILPELCKIRRAVVSRTVATSDTTSFLKAPNCLTNITTASCPWCAVRMSLAICRSPLVLQDLSSLMDKSHFLPMATTEGVLVAKTSRGCKVINAVAAQLRSYW